METHTIYRREVGLGAPLGVRTRLVAADNKRLTLMHEMRSRSDEIALQEVLFLHVDLRTRRAVPLGGDAADRVQALAPPPGWVPPPWLGRHVGQAR